MSNSFKTGDLIRLKSNESPPVGLLHGEHYVVTRSKGDTVYFRDMHGEPRGSFAFRYVLVQSAPTPDDKALTWAKDRYSSDPDARAVLGDMLSEVYGLMATANTTYSFGPSPF